jgi:hypothetical protein
MIAISASLFSSQKSDNPVMATVPSELDQAVKRVVRKLRPDAVRVAHVVGIDSTGEPAIFFQVVLSNEASSEGRIGDVARRISTTIFNELRPQENWKLFPYFSFRSQAEEASRSDLE